MAADRLLAVRLLLADSCHRCRSGSFLDGYRAWSTCKENSVYSEKDRVFERPAGYQTRPFARMAILAQAAIKESIYLFYSPNFYTKTISNGGHLENLLCNLPPLQL